MPSNFEQPKFEQRVIFLCLAILRGALIPLAMFCNHSNPDFPKVFLHDAVPIIIVMLLGLTNGYFVSLAVSYAPK